MLPTGIDRLSFYTPRYCLDLKLLAAARGVKWEKYTVGLGQELMAVPPPDEDIVTMAASAAKPILDEVGRDDIELVLFATESGVWLSSLRIFAIRSMTLSSRFFIVIEPDINTVYITSSL